MNIIRKESKVITANSMDITNIIKEYYEQHCAV